MADIHVSTIPDFKTALQTAGAKVILDSDLDFNSTTISGTWANVKATEIDGQGHTLYNIQSASSSSVFVAYVTSLITWHNINFYNVLLLGSGYLISGYNVSNQQVLIKECKVQGKLNRLFQYLNDSSSVEGGAGCVRSAFNINSDCRFNETKYTECYFILQESTATFSTYSSLLMYDCYMSGHARFPASTIMSSQSARNVINIYNDADTTPTLNGRYILYNSDRATFSGGIPLTDTELKDRDAVAATGFPIL